MSDTAIKIENLGKRYRYGGAAPLSHNLRADITEWAKGLIRRREPRVQSHESQPSTLRSPPSPASEPSALSPQPSTPPHHPSLHEVHEKHLDESPEYFWALRDINLEIKQGEVVGIIGRNGAGKSTLLKILSRITPPTTGKITYHGRVSSLLEVGTGFHRELTGRENVFLNGSILGMRRAEIARKFDEIVAFAEVEKFLDTPVKFYSSGMYVRLAFAVAAHLEPEILVVDEVLAVGDASFQKKCLGKMGDVAKQGRTILFVSHNMTAIKSLCRSGFLLNQGTIVTSGEISGVIDAYVSSDTFAVCSRYWDSPTESPGPGPFRFKSIVLATDAPHRTDHLTVKTPFRVSIDLWASRPGTVNLSLQMNLLSGEIIFAVASQRIQLVPGEARFVCHFPSDLLNDGAYSLNAMIVEGDAPRYVLREALVFEVHDVARSGSWVGKWPGLVRPQLSWNCAQTTVTTLP
jgi:lipopolysaccharide transport system ATP-binding protein